MRVLVSGFCTEDVINGKPYFGGAAGGMALNLASLGVRTGLLSILGDDKFSAQYEKELSRRSVDISLVTRLDHRLPKLEVVSRMNSERARQFNDFGTRNDLSHLTPPVNRLRLFEILHAVNTPQQLCDYLAEHFTGEISYCPGSMFIRDSSELSGKLLLKTRYLFCNEVEFEKLQDHIAVKELFMHNLKCISVSQAEKGVKLLQPNKKALQFPAVSAGVIDTTGAGDAVAVGFLNAVSQGGTIEDGIQEGIRLAAKAVQQPGVVIR